MAVSQGGPDLENAQTIAYMAKYGWRRVRGGRFTSPAMSAQPKVLGSVLARGVPMRESKPAFLDELVLVDGHVLRFFKALGGELLGALSGPRAGGEKRFPGIVVEEVQARAERWLRGRRRRSVSRSWGDDVGMFIVFRKRRWLFDENSQCDIVKGADNDFRFSNLSELCA